MLVAYDIEIAKGNGIKKIEKSEKTNVNSIRRKAITSINLKRGDRFTPKNIKWLRSDSGIGVEYLKKIFNSKSKKNLKKDMVIKKSYIS